MNVISYRKKSYSAPEGWHECTPAQRGSLIAFARLPEADRTDDIVQMAAQIWLQVPDREWQRWRLDAHQWATLQAGFAWIWEPPTTRPFESFVHEGDTYHVFDEDFSDTKALDLTMALMEYMAFAQPTVPDLSAYGRILATLCRPARVDLEHFRRSDDWDGDVREPYNELRAVDRARKLVSLPEPIKLALFDYFERSAHQFLLHYERLFGGSSTEEPRYPDGRGWLMLLKNVAKDGHFGDFDRVGRQPAHLVYAALLDDVLTNDEITNPTDHE